MLDPWWILFLSIGFLVMALGFLVAIGFLIYVSLEIRRTAIAVQSFLKNSDERIKPLLEEAEQTIRSIKKVSDDVGSVTDNVRNLSGAVHEIAVNLKALSGLTTDFREGVSLRVTGLRVGVKTALNVLLKSLRS